MQPDSAFYIIGGLVALIMLWMCLLLCTVACDAFEDWQATRGTSVAHAAPAPPLC